MNQTEKLINFHTRSFSEKSAFLGFISDIGRLGLAKLFSIEQGGYSLWWYSLVAEKPPFKSDAYEKLINVLIDKNRLRELQNGPSGWKEHPVSHFLRGCGRLARLFFNVVRAQSRLENRSERVRKLSEQDYTIVSYFPFLNREKAADGIFENRYLPTFHNQLATKRQGRYGHICVTIDLDGHNFDDAVDFARSFSNSENLILIEEFITLPDMLNIVWLFVSQSCRYLLNLKHIRRLLIYPDGAELIDIWPIFRRDFHSSFCGCQLAMSLFYIAAFRNMVRELRPGSKVLSICEMQWWERALYSYARERGVVTVGYQHTIVPALLLNYFNDAGEMSWNGDAVNYCPLPDYLATVGEAASRMFIQNQWPQQRVFSWGAQRFESLKDLMSGAGVGWGQKGNFIVCAFSIGRAEAEEILTMLQAAFRDVVEPCFKIYLKSHPSLNVVNVAKECAINLDERIFEFTDQPLEILTRSAKAMIVTESSSTFYALAFGCKVIIPRFDNILDCNPLSYVSDIPCYVYSPDELLAACNAAVTNPPTPEQLDKSRNFLHDYLHFPDTPECYLEMLDAL